MDVDKHSQSNRKSINKESNGPRIVVEMVESDPMMDDDSCYDVGEKAQPRTAPDGGYGWFIVLGCFIQHICMGTLERSDGIFFLEFQKKFGLGAQVTAWPGALVSTMRLCLGPVASAVCNRYSTRTSVLIGSILVFVGLFLNSLAPNFYFLFFSHFLVQGLGRGLVYAPGLIIIGMYFDKRRGLAAGLGTSGAGVGTFLLIPVSQLLFDTYGYQGAFMVIAAFSLNFSVSAMLFRPLSLNYKFTEGREEKTADRISLQEGLVAVNAMEASDVQSIRSWKAYHSSRQNVNSSIVGDEEDDNDRRKDNHSSQLKQGCFKSSLNICFPLETSNKVHGGKNKLFHFHLLKNPSFFIFCISIMLFTAAFKSANTFIPAQVKSVGYTESEAAMVLSVSGITDTISRILSGFVFDLAPVKSLRPIIYTVLIFLIATVCITFPMLEEYYAICLACAVYGFLTGAYVSQKSTITVDILGASQITNSFGILVLFQGLGMMIGPPLSGALKDAYGTFHLAFQVGGSAVMCAAFLMIASNIFLMRQRRRNESY